MRTLVTSCQLLGHDCHTISSLSPLSATPRAYPKELQWFERLTKPTSELDSSDGTRRALDLLRLRSACACERVDFDQLSLQAQKEAAFEFAQEIPFFDRDLTSFYMGHCASAEYELHVAHSLLRLTPDLSLSHLTQCAFPEWREQGLVHVLVVAAIHMPSAQSDWGVDDEGLAALLASLAVARSYDQAGECIAAFIATQDPGSEDHARVALTLDRLAVLMRVKSNAPTSEPAAHSLDLQLKTFPCLEASCQPEAWPDLVPALWTTIKSSIECSLPPSLLLPSTRAGGVW